MVKLLTVLGLGMIELWAAIPAGLALQLHPVATGVTAAIGAMIGALIVVFLGESLRTWLLRHHGSKEGKEQHGHIKRIWHRYGVPGLGLSAPLLIGAPLGVALGVILGAPAPSRRGGTGRLLFWISLGIVLWSAVLTLFGALGLAGLEALTPL